MPTSFRWPYYVATAAVFLAAKLLYAHAATADVRLLLAPTNVLVGWMLNSDSGFEPAHGYVHAGLRIVIDKSCAGGNFWLLSWLLLSWAYVHGRGRQPVAAVVGLAVVCLVFTWLVNAARIIGAVQLARLLPAYAPHPAWLHEAQGALVYLFFLVAAHGALLFLLSNPASYRAHSA